MVTYDGDLGDSIHSDDTSSPGTNSNNNNNNNGNNKYPSFFTGIKTYRNHGGDVYVADDVVGGVASSLSVSSETTDGGDGEKTSTLLSLSSSSSSTKQVAAPETAIPPPDTAAAASSGTASGTGTEQDSSRESAETHNKSGGIATKLIRLFPFSRSSDNSSSNNNINNNKDNNNDNGNNNSNNNKNNVHHRDSSASGGTGRSSIASSSSHNTNFVDAKEKLSPSTEGRDSITSTNSFLSSRSNNTENNGMNHADHITAIHTSTARITGIPTSLPPPPNTIRTSPGMDSDGDKDLLSSSGQNSGTTATIGNNNNNNNKRKRRRHPPTEVECTDKKECHRTNEDESVALKTLGTDRRLQHHNNNSNSNSNNNHQHPTPLDSDRKWKTIDDETIYRDGVNNDAQFMLSPIQRKKVIVSRAKENQHTSSKRRNKEGRTTSEKKALAAHSSVSASASASASASTLTSAHNIGINPGIDSDRDKGMVSSSGKNSETAATNSSSSSNNNNSNNITSKRSRNSPNGKGNAPDKRNRIHRTTAHGSSNPESVAGVHSPTFSTEGATGGGAGGSSDTTGPSSEVPNLSSRSDTTKIGSRNHGRVGDTHLQLPTSVQSPERTAKSSVMGLDNTKSHPANDAARSISNTDKENRDSNCTEGCTAVLPTSEIKYGAKLLAGVQINAPAPEPTPATATGTAKSQRITKVYTEIALVNANAGNNDSCGNGDVDHDRKSNTEGKNEGAAVGSNISNEVSVLSTGPSGYASGGGANFGGQHTCFDKKCINSKLSSSCNNSGLVIEKKTVSPSLSPQDDDDDDPDGSKSARRSTNNEQGNSSTLDSNDSDDDDDDDDKEEQQNEFDQDHQQAAEYATSATTATTLAKIVPSPSPTSPSPSPEKKKMDATATSEKSSPSSSSIVEKDNKATSPDDSSTTSIASSRGKNNIKNVDDIAGEYEFTELHNDIYAVVGGPTNKAIVLTTSSMPNIQKKKAAVASEMSSLSPIASPSPSPSPSPSLNTKKNTDTKAGKELSSSTPTEISTSTVHTSDTTKSLSPTSSSLEKSSGSTEATIDTRFSSADASNNESGCTSPQMKQCERDHHITSKGDDASNDDDVLATATFETLSSSKEEKEKESSESSSSSPMKIPPSPSPSTSTTQASSSSSAKSSKYCSGLKTSSVHGDIDEASIIHKGGVEEGGDIESIHENESNPAEKENQSQQDSQDENDENDKNSSKISTESPDGTSGDRMTHSVDGEGGEIRDGNGNTDEHIQKTGEKQQQQQKEPEQEKVDEEIECLSEPVEKQLLTSTKNHNGNGNMNERTNSNNVIADQSNIEDKNEGGAGVTQRTTGTEIDINIDNSLDTTVGEKDTTNEERKEASPPAQTCASILLSVKSASYSSDNLSVSFSNNNDDNEVGGVLTDTQTTDHEGNRASGSNSFSVPTNANIQPPNDSSVQRKTSIHVDEETRSLTASRNDDDNNGSKASNDSLAVPSGDHLPKPSSTLFPSTDDHIQSQLGSQDDNDNNGSKTSLGSPAGPSDDDDGMKFAKGNDNYDGDSESVDESKGQKNANNEARKKASPLVDFFDPTKRLSSTSSLSSFVNSSCNGSSSNGLQPISVLDGGEEEGGAIELVSNDGLAEADLGAGVSSFSPQHSHRRMSAGGQSQHQPGVGAMGAALVTKSSTTAVGTELATGPMILDRDILARKPAPPSSLLDSGGKYEENNKSDKAGATNYRNERRRSTKDNNDQNESKDDDNSALDVSSPVGTTADAPPYQQHSHRILLHKGGVEEGGDTESISENESIPADKEFIGLPTEDGKLGDDKTNQCNVEDDGISPMRTPLSLKFPPSSTDVDGNQISYFVHVNKNNNVNDYDNNDDGKELDTNNEQQVSDDDDGVKENNKSTSSTIVDTSAPSPNENEQQQQAPQQKSVSTNSLTPSNSKVRVVADATGRIVDDLESQTKTDKKQGEIEVGTPGTDVTQTIISPLGMKNKGIKATSEISSPSPPSLCYMELDTNDSNHDGDSEGVDGSKGEKNIDNDGLQPKSVLEGGEEEDGDVELFSNDKNDCAGAKNNRSQGRRGTKDNNDQDESQDDDIPDLQEKDIQPSSRGNLGTSERNSEDDRESDTDVGVGDDVDSAEEDEKSNDDELQGASAQVMEIFNGVLQFGHVKPLGTWTLTRLDLDETNVKKLKKKKLSMLTLNSKETGYAEIVRHLVQLINSLGHGFDSTPATTPSKKILKFLKGQGVELKTRGDMGINCRKCASEIFSTIINVLMNTKTTYRPNSKFLYETLGLPVHKNKIISKFIEGSLEDYSKDAETITFIQESSNSFPCQIDRNGKHNYEVGKLLFRTKNGEYNVFENTIPYTIKKNDKKYSVLTSDYDGVHELDWEEMNEWLEDNKCSIMMWLYEKTKKAIPGARSSVENCGPFAAFTLLKDTNRSQEDETPFSLKVVIDQMPSVDNRGHHTIKDVCSFLEQYGFATTQLAIRPGQHTKFFSLTTGTYLFVTGHRSEGERTDKAMNQFNQHVAVFYAETGTVVDGAKEFEFAAGVEKNQETINKAFEEHWNGKYTIIEYYNVIDLKNPDIPEEAVPLFKRSDIDTDVFPLIKNQVQAWEEIREIEEEIRETERSEMGTGRRVPPCKYCRSRHLKVCRKLAGIISTSRATAVPVPVQAPPQRTSRPVQQDFSRASFAGSGSSSDAYLYDMDFYSRLYSHQDDTENEVSNGNDKGNVHRMDASTVADEIILTNRVVAGPAQAPPESAKAGLNSLLSGYGSSSDEDND